MGFGMCRCVKYLLLCLFCLSFFYSSVGLPLFQLARSSREKSWMLWRVEQTLDHSGLVPPLFVTAKELTPLVPALNEFKSDSISAQLTTSLRPPNCAQTIQTQDGHPERKRRSRLCILNQ